MDLVDAFLALFKKNTRLTIPTLFPIIHLSLNSFIYLPNTNSDLIYLQCAKNKSGYTAAKAFSLTRW